MIDLGPELSAWFKSDEVQDQLKTLICEAVEESLGHLLDGELLDAKEAAKVLSMTVGAVHKAVERGQLPCVRHGRRLRFRRSELLGSLGR